MSAGAMTRHKLDVIRSIDGFENVLVKSLTPDPVVEALFPNRGIYAGRCLSRNAANDNLCELGVTGNRVPYWLFRDTNKPSGGWSDPTPVEDATDVTYKDGSEHKLLCYAGIEGLELATTEFAGSPPAINTFLTAPHQSTLAPGDVVDEAGVVIAAGNTYGKTPIVGIVSDTVRSPHRVNMIVFYTLYRPPIQAIPDDIEEPEWD